MNLEPVKARMTTRDHWMLLDEAGRAFVIQGLADDVPGLVQEIERLAGIADRANKAMEKHQKHNGALEISVQEAHRELDGAVKDGNRLADALVKSREEVVALKLQNERLQKVVDAAKVWRHEESADMTKWYALCDAVDALASTPEKPKSERSPYTPNLDYPEKPITEKQKEPSNMCHEITKYDGGPIYCYQPLPCRIHG